MKKTDMQRPRPARPEETAAALAKAAVQTAQRSLFTAQACFRCAGQSRSGSTQWIGEATKVQSGCRYMTALRDALLDALNTVPEEARKRISAVGVAG